jgi:hypothetical protein
MPGVAFTTEPSVLKMEVVSSPEDVVVGFRVWIFNFEFILVLTRLPSHHPSILEHSQYHPEGIIVQGSSTTIRFKWDEATVGDTLVVKWLGPG